MTQVGPFSSQTEYDVIYKLHLTCSFFLTFFIWGVTLFRRSLHTHICLDIYPEAVEVEAIEI